MEFLSGLALLLVRFEPGYFLSSSLTAVFILVLLAITFIDIEQGVIPDSLNYAGITSGLLFSLINGNLTNSLLGMLTGFLFMFCLARVSSIILKREAMGEGDIWLAVMLGSFLGFEKLFLGLFMAFVFGAVLSLIMVLLKFKTLKDSLPFGPLLALSAVISFFWGDKIIFLYLSPFVI